MAHATRRLVAILGADAAGYSRLMGEDEPGTMAALAECQSIFRRLCDASNGRIVDTAGDSVLAVFDSVADAVLSAMTTQQRVDEWNAPRSPERRLLFRVGVHLGDVLVHPDGRARLGGSRGIATFARDLFGRAIAHPTLGRFWKGRSTYGVLREERLLIAYLSSVTGGPTRYAGRDMKMAHRGLGITADDWNVFRAMLSETVTALRIEDPQRRELVDFAESLRPDIVQG